MCMFILYRWLLVFFLLLLLLPSLSLRRLETIFIHSRTFYIRLVYCCCFFFARTLALFLYIHSLFLSIPLLHFSFAHHFRFFSVLFSVVVYRYDLYGTIYIHVYLCVEQVVSECGENKRWTATKQKCISDFFFFGALYVIRFVGGFYFYRLSCVCVCVVQKKMPKIQLIFFFQPLWHFFTVIFFLKNFSLIWLT